MFSKKDINPYGYIESPEISLNINVLLDGLNKLIDAGAPMERVTSGLRNELDQKRINPNAMKSKHLIGAAADIADPDGYLCNWLFNNILLLRNVGMFIENPAKTPGWIHFQIYPPTSGRLCFIP